MFKTAAGVTGLSFKVSFRYARCRAVIDPADSPATAIRFGLTPCFVNQDSAVFASSIATASPTLRAVIASGGA